jgi:NAD(P)-dependent dehydrogenase (short-subunit alcohol dehydrogenase family)
MKMMKNKIWYITGASKGLGLALAKKLLNEGFRVAATSRNISELSKAVDNSSGNFLPLNVSLTDEASVQNSIAKTIEHFGRIDVVVNNAGYGLTGALEELSDKEARANFDINVFGTLNVIRSVLPYLRQQQSGHIFNIASIGGFTGNFPGFGIYCATKFAVHGLTESLAAEIKPFGIFATVVSPGYFRTHFLSDTSLNVPANSIADYSIVREVEKNHRQDINFNQQGDPGKAAEVMIAVATTANPPVHLFLGQDAYDLAEVKIKDLRKDLELMKVSATATAFKAAVIV